MLPVGGIGPEKLLSFDDVSTGSETGSDETHIEEDDIHVGLGEDCFWKRTREALYRSVQTAVFSNENQSHGQPTLKRRSRNVSGASRTCTGNSPSSWLLLTSSS